MSDDDQPDQPVFKEARSTSPPSRRSSSSSTSQTLESAPPPSTSAQSTSVCLRQKQFTAHQRSRRRSGRRMGRRTRGCRRGCSRQSTSRRCSQDSCSTSPDSRRSCPLPAYRSSSAVVHLRIKPVNPSPGDVQGQNLARFCPCTQSDRRRGDLHRHIQGDRDEERGSLFFPRPQQDEADPPPSETPLMERGGRVEQGYR
uniref:BY PROTMAP: gi/472583595/gb/EMS21228.1/ voltage-gated chloride channel [Rhodosporidium toruloides NP11] n=1 Tax=Rhodotorula toruloides TaxID=5286 RepID=A0A0K3C4D4_RHOTO